MVVVTAGIEDSELCVTSVHTVVVVVSSRSKGQQWWMSIEVAAAISGATLALS